METLNSYDGYVPLLDDVPNIDELNIALKSVKRGVSFDGLPPKVLVLLPPVLKEVILILIQFWSSVLIQQVTEFILILPKPGSESIPVWLKQRGNHMIPDSGSDSRFNKSG